MRILLSTVFWWCLFDTYLFYHLNNAILYVFLTLKCHKYARAKRFDLFDLHVSCHPRIPRGDFARAKSPLGIRGWFLVENSNIFKCKVWDLCAYEITRFLRNVYRPIAHCVRSNPHIYIHVCLERETPGQY